MANMLELLREMMESLRSRDDAENESLGVGTRAINAARMSERQIHEIPVDLVFDDEPLAELLYGRVTHGPSTANIYSPIKRLEQALSGTDGTAIEHAFHNARACCESGPSLLPDIASQLSSLARRCLPQWPKPLNAELPTAGLQLLEVLWNRSLESNHRATLVNVGGVLWGWYEYARCPAMARDVLEKLVGQCPDQNENGLQVHVNNLAYQHFLLKDWANSAQSYRLACEIAERNDNRSEFLNSRVGWWAATYEASPNAVAADLVAELRSVLSEIQGLNRPMLLRKALHCLARAEARLGQKQAALAFIDQALEIDRRYEAMFLEEDLALRASILDIQEF